MDDAIAIFMLNVDSFPKSWNECDSLAEALAAKDDKAAAIKNHIHSIELNPENISGIRKLQDLASK